MAALLAFTMAVAGLAMPAGARAQQVEQRIDSLQMLIGQQTVLHLKATAPEGAKVVMPSFKPRQQLAPGIEVVEQSKADTAHMGDRMEGAASM